MSDERTFRMFVPKRVLSWLFREFPHHQTEGVQIHGAMCGLIGGCGMSCRCWCHKWFGGAR